MQTHTTRTQTALIPDRPDLDLYLLAHRSMVECSAALAQAVAEVAAEPSPPARRIAALRRWYEGFADEILVHHHIEDVLMFPALAERISTYGEYGDHLAADHADLDVVIEGLRAALAQGDFPEAQRYADELRDHLDEHLGFENAEIVPLFVRHFTPDELGAINEEAVKMTPGKQMLFTCPWLVSMLTPQERDHVFAEVPKALEVVWWLTRRRYRRLASRALGAAAPTRG